MQVRHDRQEPEWEALDCKIIIVLLLSCSTNKGASFSDRTLMGLQGVGHQKVDTQARMNLRDK